MSCLNTVAFNRTELCEEDPLNALAVNTWPPARWRRSVGNGSTAPSLLNGFCVRWKEGRPYAESDVPNPLNVYGFSKYGGERFVLAASDRNIVCRTAGLYGAAGSRAKGGNFVQAILSRAKKGEPLRVVNDIFQSPTFARDLAEKVWELVGLKTAGGIFHLTNGGGCSWFQLAQAILEIERISATLTPIASAQWPGKMRRSPDTRLVSERLASFRLPPLRPWRDALTAYLKETSA
jgi:dTDP-4-dehydrorhamnose reductase